MLCPADAYSSPHNSAGRTVLLLFHFTARETEALWTCPSHRSHKVSPFLLKAPSLPHSVQTACLSPPADSGQPHVCAFPAPTPGYCLNLRTPAFRTPLWQGPLCPLHPVGPVTEDAGLLTPAHHSALLASRPPRLPLLRPVPKPCRHGRTGPRAASQGPGLRDQAQPNGYNGHTLSHGSVPGGSKSQWNHRGQRSLCR